jgi:hypothetical protein
MNLPKTAKAIFGLQRALGVKEKIAQFSSLLLGTI